MTFLEKTKKYLTDQGITVLGHEQEGDNKSVVFHIDRSDNEKVADIKDGMEMQLNVYVAQSDMFGMNTVIVEANDLDE
jgi:hypothetical protein